MSEQQRCLETRHLFLDMGMASAGVVYLDLKPKSTVNFDPALFIIRSCQLRWSGITYHDVLPRLSYKLQLL